MKALLLFDHTSTYDGIYVMFMVNRMQMLYFFIIMPLYLADSSMIWGILAIGFLSQMILIMLSKWLASNFSTKVIKVLYSSLESEWFVFLPLPDFFSF
ncbi:hypothetical protein [Bacillus methanolicus]|uniref:hypothetical protein n=1 Tax=Bacillus methanolicus TaxID=1471 RepID=UPI00025F26E5|nr:hypothetical protein [Bacillus methanolicus]EIJ79734.1 hypothetical protein MGA3_15321 [Bacillus methanolicus MGA3]